MWHMLWPLLLTVFANVFYNISQKSTPNGVNPFAALMVTYLTAGTATAILFLCTAGTHAVGTELHKLNWTSFVLGTAIVGLEIGYLFLYRSGWKISVGSLVSNIALAIALVFVGVLFYNETLSLKQVLGMVICAVGLIMITV